MRPPEALEGGRALGGALERPPVAAALEQDELPADARRQPLGEARRDVRIVAAFPFTSSGKVDRQRLKAEYLA